MRKYILAAAGLAFALALPKLSIADMTGLVIAKIPQEFTAGSAKLPAGDYEIEESDSAPAALVLRDTATGKAVLVPYLTRLAQRDDQNELVFDKVGGALSLSEVHVVGSDGYYVAGVRREHTHVKVKAAKKG